MNFANWCNGEVSQSAKIWLSKSVFNVKNHPNLADFFFIEEYECRVTFLLLAFCITLIFKWFYFLIWCLIFDSSPLVQFSKFNHFLWECWFLAKNHYNFVSLSWKLHNRYCHTFGSSPSFYLSLMKSYWLRQIQIIHPFWQ